MTSYGGNGRISIDIDNDHDGKDNLELAIVANSTLWIQGLSIVVSLLFVFDVHALDH